MHAGGCRGLVTDNDGRGKRAARRGLCCGRGRTKEVVKALALPGANHVGVNGLRVPGNFLKTSVDENRRKIGVNGKLSACAVYDLVYASRATPPS